MTTEKVDWGKLAEEGDLLASSVTNLTIKQNSTPPETNGVDASDTEKAPTAAEESLLKKLLHKSLVESKQELEIQRKNPHSPLYSVKSFEELKLQPKLLMGVYDMGFMKPSKIQEMALPTLLADPPGNMIAQSQSGTGKTAAFVLAMLSRVDTSKPYPQVLCLSPTYELAIQTGEVAAKMSKHCPEIKIKYAVRGEQMARGEKITDHIIIGTPGKALDWSLKFRFFDLNKITVFVLDEADVMIATQGHQDQCIRIHKMLPKTCQIMFFSATYEKAVMDFAEIIVDAPMIIRLLKEEECLDNIKQFYVNCQDMEAKYDAITTIYTNLTGQAIIFCHTRRTASWLAEKMVDEGFTVAVLSGDMTVEDRIRVLDLFKEGCVTVLVTTNVLARGIDVDQVSLVVNFDLPIDQQRKADHETYLHRIGRTGRFGKKGIAVNLVDSPQAAAICQDMERHFGKKIELLDIGCRDLKAKIRQ
ncbi:DEAD-box helicase Dbp80 [Diachasma alloeum]|uniref:DEAD-box helicase Dbp80 n=1 Tax=Diachasma alloeum TaxID=454923 RepID=UPI000738191A|nr:DEAD-box helicase Dbp80 [Diachasma alloeum]